MTTKASPKGIKTTGDQIAITWSDGHAGQHVGRDLRMACRCAACIDEWTHENRIIPAQIPGLVKPTAIEAVGHYALHFTWSDGHNTGIYTYDYLRELCSCDDCRKTREFSV